MKRLHKALEKVDRLVNEQKPVLMCTKVEMLLNLIVIAETPGYEGQGSINQFT